MYPCCQTKINLVAQPPDAARPDVTILVCAVCQRRHIEVTITPGVMGVRGAQM